MSTQASRDTSRPRATRRSDWTIRQDEILLGIMRKMVLEGKVNDGHYTEMWKQIIEEYRKQSGDTSTDKRQCQGRWKTLKSLYSLADALQNISGWGWDFINHWPTSPNDQAWEEMIALNPEYKKLRNKSFPQWNDMNFLCGKNISKGYNCVKGTGVDDENLGSPRSDQNDVEEVGLSTPVHNTVEDDEVHVVGGTFPEFVESESPCVTPARQPRSAAKKKAPFYSSSGSKRRHSGSSSTRQTGYEQYNEDLLECSRQHLQQNAKYLRSQLSHDDIEREILECTQKLRQTPGMTTEILVKAVQFLKKKEDRSIVHALTGSELFAWATDRYWERSAGAPRSRTQSADAGRHYSEPSYSQPQAFQRSGYATARPHDSRVGYSLTEDSLTSPYKPRNEVVGHKEGTSSKQRQLFQMLQDDDI